MNTLAVVQYRLSALHYAYSRGHKKIIKMLIEANGDVDAMNGVSIRLYPLHSYIYI